MCARRQKFLIYVILTAGCLFETVGCPQLLGNSFRTGTRSFFDTGLTEVLLSSLDWDQLLGLDSEP